MKMIDDQSMLQFENAIKTFLPETGHIVGVPVVGATALGLMANPGLAASSTGPSVQHGGVTPGTGLGETQLPLEKLIEKLSSENDQLVTQLKNVIAS